MFSQSFYYRFQIPQKPIYINLIRRPLDRLVSYYYFLRYGDNFRPNLVRRKAGDKMVWFFSLETFISTRFLGLEIEIVIFLSDIRRMCETKATRLWCKIHVAAGAILLWSCSWVLVNMFALLEIFHNLSMCTPRFSFLKNQTLSVCRKPGSEWALEQAKYNLVNNYFLVGVTEEMEDFIYLLELSLPRFVYLHKISTVPFE